jgi:hypothetical protein
MMMVNNDVINLISGISSFREYFWVITLVTFMMMVNNDVINLISGISSFREYFWVITGFITKTWHYY